MPMTSRMLRWDDVIVYFTAGKEQVTSEDLFLDGLCHSLFSVGKEQVTSVYPRG